MKRIMVYGALLAGLCGAGWFVWRWQSTPAPLEIALEGVGQPLADDLRQALEATRQQPRSADAWGELGMILGANGYSSQAAHCFMVAESLEPGNSHWLYLRALNVLEANPHLALDLMAKSLTSNTASTERAAIHFRIAQTLIEDVQLAKVAPHLAELRKVEPDGPRVLFIQALLALAENDRAAAVQHLRRLTDVPFIKLRAHTLLATLAEPDEARKLQEVAARLPIDSAWPDPIEQRMLERRASRVGGLDTYRALKDQGRGDAAMQFLRDLVGKAPDAENSFVLAFALYEVGQFEEAEKHFLVAVQFEPTNVKSHLLIGSCRLMLGEKRLQEPGGKEQAMELFRQAVAAEDRALAMQKENGMAHLTRGTALKHLERTQEAVAAFRRAVLVLPDYANAHLQLGEALGETGQWQEAIEHLQFAVQFARPDDDHPAQALRRWQAKAAESKLKKQDRP